MKTRTLRRKVIIREYDFEKVKEQAIGPIGFIVDMRLYDRAEFTPLKLDEMEKLHLVNVLKGKDIRMYESLTFPSVLLLKLKDYLYNEKYIEWNPEYDEDGYVWIQARKNTPRTRLGWGVFEKDLTSRL